MPTRPRLARPFSHLTAQRLLGLTLAAAVAVSLASPAHAQKKYGGDAPRRGSNYDFGNTDADPNNRNYGYDNGLGDGTPDEYGYNPNPGYNNPGYANRRGGNGTFDNGDFRGRRSFEGVVARDLTGSRFVLRADDGRQLNVTLRREEARGLSLGDRVRVSGRFRDDVGRDRSRAEFDADTLQILDGRDGSDYGSGGYGTSRRVSFPATVVDRNSSRTLTVRGDNGRTYTVEARSNGARFGNGERVRVEGTSRNGVVSDARLTPLRDGWNSGNGGYQGGYNGREGTFIGRVDRVDTRGGTITVRDDATRRSYTFRPKEPGDFRTGQRVEATLGQRDGRVVLTKVARL